MSRLLVLGTDGICKVEHRRPYLTGAKLICSFPSDLSTMQIFEIVIGSDFKEPPLRNNSIWESDKPFSTLIRSQGSA